VTSSEAVGRLLGLSAVSPNLGTIIEDLLTSNEGLEVWERPVTKEEIGRSPSQVDGERVIAVVRNKTLRRFYDPTVATLEGGDQVVVVRQATEEAEQQTISAGRRNRAAQRS
jgi:voltage-gated potassium channel